MRISDKEKIYNLHLKNYGFLEISRQFGISKLVVQYVCRLADRHGIGIFHRKRVLYTTEFKLHVYHSTDKEIQVKNDGYYIFSRKYKELLRVTEVKYYSYIAKPSDIRNELIIVDQ